MSARQVLLQTLLLSTSLDRTQNPQVKSSRSPKLWRSRIIRKQGRNLAHCAVKESPACSQDHQEDFLCIHPEHMHMQRQQRGDALMEGDMDIQLFQVEQHKTREAEDMGDGQQFFLDYEGK